MLFLPLNRDFDVTDFEVEVCQPLHLQVFLEARVISSPSRILKTYAMNIGKKLWIKGIRVEYIKLCN